MPTTLDKQNQGTKAQSEKPRVLRSTISTLNKQNQGTSAQSEKHSVSTHDATGFKKTADVLDGPESEEVVHGRSDSVGSSSATSGLESPHGSVDKHEQEPTPRVGSNPADLDHGADVDSSPAPSVASPQLRPSPKQAGEQDTLDAPAPHSMGGKSGGLKAQSKGLPADTGSKPTTRDRGDDQISKPLKDLQSSALPQSQNVLTNNATSSSSRAGRGRHVSNSWGWIRITLSILLGLIGIGVICVADRHCLSVGRQKSIDLAYQAGLGVYSASAWMLYTAGQLYQRSPALQAPRTSSREEIGLRLGETYTGLSQALVQRNLLHDGPELLRQKRGEAMRFRLPDDSLISKDLVLFLQLTADADEDMLNVMFRIYQVSTLALRQQKLTDGTLSSIQQRTEYWSMVGPIPIWKPLRVFFMGTSSQEAQLRSRLTDHFGLLYEKITAADASTYKALQRFYKLASTTENIRQSCLEEEQRLLLIKGVTAAHVNWLFRVAMQYNILPESEDIAEISRNVELANNIHEWLEGIIKLLEHITKYLKYAKVQVGSLMEILRAGGTLKWTEDTKNAELMEFLAQIAEGFALLIDNSAAWINYSSPGKPNRTEPRAWRDREAVV